MIHTSADQLLDEVWQLRLEAGRRLALADLLENQAWRLERERREVEP